MTMTIKNGKNFDELLQTLGNRKLMEQSVNDAPDTLTVDFQAQKIVRWKITSPTKANNHTLIKRGTRFDYLSQMIETLNKEVNLFEPDQFCSVLCFLDEKKMKSGYKSRWFRIDPGVPYEITSKGQPKFNIESFQLNEREREKMMETKLAFYHNGEIYPILKEAIPSIGSLLDCTAAFKDMDEHQLGSAILISEKLAKKKKGIRLLYREHTGKMKPVVSICGSKFNHLDLKEIFSKIYDLVSKEHIYKVDKWFLYDDSVQVYLEYLDETEHVGIIISAGDLPGNGVSITSYAKVNECYIPLKWNVKRHNGMFPEKNYELLMTGIESSLRTYLKDVERLKEESVAYTEDLLTDVYAALGKKRSAALELSYQDGSKYPAYDLFVGLVKETYTNLPEKQAGMLRKAYAGLYRGIVRKVED